MGKLRKHKIVTLENLVHKVKEAVCGVLPIVVHIDEHIAGDERQRRHLCRTLSEITREVHADDLRIIPAQRRYHVEGFVIRIVVHENDLIIKTFARTDRGAKLVHNSGNRPRRFVTWYGNRNRNHTAAPPMRRQTHSFELLLTELFVRSPQIKPIYARLRACITPVMTMRVHNCVSF